MSINKKRMKNALTDNCSHTYATLLSGKETERERKIHSYCVTINSLFGIFYTRINSFCERRWNIANDFTIDRFFRFYDWLLAYSTTWLSLDEITVCKNPKKKMKIMLQALHFSAEIVDNFGENCIRDDSPILDDI